MKKKLRSGLFILAAILFLLLYKWGVDKTATSFENSSSGAVTTVSQTPAFSPSVASKSIIATEMAKAEQIEEELEEIEELPDIYSSSNISVRYQNGIELSTENLEFEISEASIKKLNSIYSAYPQTTIAWGLYSLKDDSYIAFNKDSEFTSCSTIKVVYSLYCLEQVKQGKASLEDILVYDRNKHHYNSKTASTSTIAKLGRTKFTLKEVIYYTLHVSDNDAYMLLLDTFGFDEFNDYMESIGSTTALSTSMKYGHASVQNRSIEWKEIYSFYNEDDEISEFFKTTLLDAQYGYIEQGLSDLGYNTAHKSGWSNQYGAAHDCAIVYTPNGEYLMIILTQKYNTKPQKSLVTNLAPVLNSIWEDYSSSN